MRRVVFVGALAGCYTAVPAEGVPCGDGLKPCPAGQTCSPIDDRCWTDPPGGVDAKTDAPDDASTASTCVPRRLLTGGMDVTAQGWTIERVGKGTITYSGANTTLATTEGATQLIVLRGAFPPDRWSIQVIGEVATSGGCTPNNAAAAIMASFHDPGGTPSDYPRMLCIGETKASWGDGSGSLGVALKATGILKLERAMTGTGIKATVQSGGGVVSMTASGFTSNGAIAIGDQSSQLGLDSTMSILSVDLMCP
jgi:hypothetical protein